MWDLIERKEDNANRRGGASLMTPIGMVQLIYPELSYKLNGLFFEVQNKLGTKFQEKHYSKAICSLLKELKIPFKTEFSFKVEFNGESLGLFKADLIIDDKILVEIKVTDRLTVDHKKQLIRYLDALDLPLGLLVNFRARPLQVMRVIKSARH